MSTPAPPRPPKSSSTPPTHPTRQLLDELDALMQRMLALPVNQLDEELRATPLAASRPLAAEEPSPRRPGPGAEPAALAPPNPEADTADGSLFAGTPAELPPAPSLVPLPPFPEERDNTGAPEEPDRDTLTPARSLQEETAPETEESDTEQMAPDNPGPELEDSPEKEDSAWDHILSASPEVLAAIGQRPRPEERLPPAVVAPQRAVLSTWSAAPAGAVEAPLTWWLRPLLWSNRAFDLGTAWLGPPGRWLRSPSGRALVGWVGLGLLAGCLTWVLGNGFDWTW